MELRCIVDELCKVSPFLYQADWGQPDTQLWKKLGLVIEFLCPSWPRSKNLTNMWGCSPYFGLKKAFRLLDGLVFRSIKWSDILIVRPSHIPDYIICCWYIMQEFPSGIIALATLQEKEAIRQAGSLNVVCVCLLILPQKSQISWQCLCLSWRQEMYQFFLLHRKMVTTSMILHIFIRITTANFYCKLLTSIPIIIFHSTFKNSATFKNPEMWCWVLVKYRSQLCSGSSIRLWKLSSSINSWACQKPSLAQWFVMCLRQRTGVLYG